MHHNCLFLLVICKNIKMSGVRNISLRSFYCFKAIILGNEKLYDEPAKSRIMSNSAINQNHNYLFLLTPDPCLPRETNPKEFPKGFHWGLLTPATAKSPFCSCIFYWDCSK